MNIDLDSNIDDVKLCSYSNYDNNNNNRNNNNNNMRQ